MVISLSIQAVGSRQNINERKVVKILKTFWYFSFDFFTANGFLKFCDFFFS